MKILIVTHNDGQGGAAKALRRIAAHLREHGHETRFLVARKSGGCEQVQGPGNTWRRWMATARAYSARLILYLFTGSRSADRSLGFFPSGLVADINKSDADVVMLGWVGEETLSIDEIGSIRKPLVWRFSDMWPLTGTEHYLNDADFLRYSTGADGNDIGTLDIDGRMFQRKQKEWGDSIVAIAPSQWIADCIRLSRIGAHWPLHLVPTPVNVDVFRPLPHASVRAELGLPLNRRLIVFSSLAAEGDPRKGGDLLFEALQSLDPTDTSCVVIGSGVRMQSRTFPLPIVETGPIDDDCRLAKYYAAADVIVIPSRLDNLPQVGLEAQACGTPVVAFDIGGMRDVVDDGVTGIRVQPFSVNGLADAIRSIIYDAELRDAYSVAARERALALWAPGKLVPRFIEAFEDARQRYSTKRSSA